MFYINRKSLQSATINSFDILTTIYFTIVAYNEINTFGIYQAYYEITMKSYSIN